jgi:hypothetical protein
MVVGVAESSRGARRMRKLACNGAGVGGQDL